MDEGDWYWLTFRTCVRVWMIDQGGGRGQDRVGVGGLVLATHHRANIRNEWWLFVILSKNLCLRGKKSTVYALTARSGVSFPNVLSNVRRNYTVFPYITEETALLFAAPSPFKCGLELECFSPLAHAWFTRNPARLDFSSYERFHCFFISVIHFHVRHLSV